ncbi:MAG: cyclic nucleotide-binding domain-containing protein [Bdellovibrionales bacterium]|nr:cyclic nucleotide-binding domain-containing protein [Bdellovibrionales bacterium]
MKVLKYLELSSDLIKKIESFFPSKIFKAQAHLFYEGQIPNSGFLILAGTIKVSKKKKIQRILKAGTLFGLSEVVNRKPISITAEAFPDTEVCFIDRTTLLEIHNKGNEDIYNVFKPLIEETIK